MSDYQFLKVSGKQRRKRTPRKASIGEGQPDVKRDATVRIGSAKQLKQGVPKWSTLQKRMDLDQILHDDRSRRLMQENDFLDERAALEHELVEVVLPVVGYGIPESAGEW
jgi:hypothetical protein